MKNQRLKGEVKRSDVIKIRCTKLEKRQIEKHAKSSNLPTATYMRIKALNHKIQKTLTQEEIDAIRILTNYDNSLIRISNLMKGRQPNLYHEIELLLGNIREWYHNIKTNDR